MGAASRWTAPAGFVLALVALVASGLRVGPGEPAVEAAGGRRLVVIGVEGLSWRDVVHGVEAGELPSFGRIADGVHAAADLLSPGSPATGEIHASVITGTLPFKHDVHGFPGERGVATASMPPAVWELLLATGHPVVVIGDPFTGVPPAPVDEQQVDDALGALIGDAEIPAALLPILRESIGGALAVAAAASQADRSHVFAYFRGIARVELGLLLHSPGPREEGRLLEAYLALVDTLIGRISSRGDAGTTFVVYSEEGNRGGPVEHRPFFPQLDRWPAMGMFVAWGDGIRTTPLPLILSPADVAPTLLYLAGEPVRNHMDGIVRVALLRDTITHGNHPLYVD
jgi:hypothetical protein